MTEIFRYNTRKAIQAPGGVDRKYRIGWITDAEKIVGFGLREPTNYRLALLERDERRERVYLERASIHVPGSLARAYGRLKRSLLRASGEDQ